MSLETIIHEGLTRPGRPVRALVLMGGGARTAYQVGVLSAVASLLGLQPEPSAGFPFQVLVGTSAGALNVAYLAGAAHQGLASFEALRRFWYGLHSEAVYRLDAPAWVRLSRLLVALKLWRHARSRGAVLDTMPLVDTLHRHVSLSGIEESLQLRAIDAVAITASSYTSACTGLSAMRARSTGSRAGAARAGAPSSSRSRSST